jgi:hypothetical protein
MKRSTTVRQAARAKANPTLTSFAARRCAVLNGLPYPSYVKMEWIG